MPIYYVPLKMNMIENLTKNSFSSVKLGITKVKIDYSKSQNVT